MDISKFFISNNFIILKLDSLRQWVKKRHLFFYIYYIIVWDAQFGQRLVK